MNAKAIQKKNNQTKKTKQSTNNQRKNPASKTSFSNQRDYDFSSTRNRGSVFNIRKSEFVSNIQPIDGPNFHVQKFEINPGLSSSFPWLSQIAPSFQKYVIKHMTFEYKTAQSTFAPGMVMFAPSFDVTASLPTSKSQMLEYAFAKRAPIWQNMSVSLSQKDIMSYKSYYVRYNAKEEILLYDPLYIMIATDAVSSDLEYIGELWISYDIEFEAPARIDPVAFNMGNWKGIATSNVMQTALFEGSRTLTGALPLHVNDNSSLVLDTDLLTGQLFIFYNYTNEGTVSHSTGLGLSTDSSSGAFNTIWLTSKAVDTSGNGGYLTGIVGLQNFAQGDIISFTTLGLLDFGTERGSGCQIYIIQGVDPWVIAQTGIVATFLEKQIEVPDIDENHSLFREFKQWISHKKN